MDTARTGTTGGLRLAGALLGGLADEWLPRRCALCAGRCGAAGLCEGCRRDLPGRHARRCTRCALPLPGAPGSPAPSGTHAGASNCPACAAHAPAFDRTLAAMDYTAPVDRWLVAFKQGGQPALGRPLAWLMTMEAARLPAPPDLVVPVPSTPDRLARRGFDPALLLARPLAAGLHRPLDRRALRRVRETASQKTLDAAARRANLQDAFVAGDAVRGRTVAVIDDVMTTGATLDAVARALRAAGATSVVNLVAARRP